MTDWSIPTSQLDAWSAGQPLSDADLQALQTFFQRMVAGLDALGVRYALTADALRGELLRATQIQTARVTR